MPLKLLELKITQEEKQLLSEIVKVYILPSSIKDNFIMMRN